MAETLRELVVALSLDSNNFSRNLRTINQQIKEAESTFKLAGAGVQNYEKTIAGTEAKLSMLGNKLTQQNRAVEQYSRALVAANQKLTDTHERQQQLTASLETARAQMNQARAAVGNAAAEYRRLASTLGESDSATIMARENLERCKEEYKAARDQVKLLEGQLKSNSKTLQNNADAVSKAQTNLNNAKATVKETEAEIRRLSEELYRMQSKWTQAGDVMVAFSKKCDTVSKALTKAGKGLTTAVTVPIVALGTAAIKASIEFESSFTSVRKTVEATEAEFEQLAAASKRMSTQVAASTSEINEVMATGGQLGIATENLESFTKVMIDLGNSCEDLNANEAATALAKFANIMGTDQKKFENIGSTLVDLGNNYATTEAAIMQMSMRLAGAGKQVGLTEAQIMSGLQAGIVAGQSGVVSAMRSAARAAVQAAQTELQIRSPSCVFRDSVGRMTMKGFSEGVLLESKQQARTIRNAMRYLTNSAQEGAVAYSNNDNRRTYNQQSSVNLSGNTFYVSGEQDIQSLAVEIAALTRRQQRGKGLRLA